MAHTISFPKTTNTYLQVEFLDHLVEGELHNAFLTNPFKQCQVQSIEEEEIEKEVLHLSAKKVEDTNQRMTNQVEEAIQGVKSKSLNDLKTLLKHLQYAYLGNNSEFPMIISSSVSFMEEEKLLKVLGKNKLALGWSIFNIKGISPSIKRQRRLNPAMKKVVQAKILKLLDVGIIYAIPNSS